MKISTLFKYIALVCCITNLISSIIWSFVVHDYNKAYERSEMAMVFLLFYGVLYTIDKNKCQKP